MLDATSGDSTHAVAAHRRPRIELETRYRSLRFFVGISNFCGMALVVLTVPIVAYALLRNPAGLLVGGGVLLLGLGVTASGQVTQIMIDIEENTRALALVARQDVDFV